MIAELPVGKSLVALVDVKDLPDLMQYSWFACKHETNVYAVRRYFEGGKKRKEYLRRRIMGCTPGDKTFVDHKDGDGLNCVRSNLQVVDCSVNNKNRTTGIAAYVKRIRGKRG